MGGDFIRKPALIVGNPGLTTAHDAIFTRSRQLPFGCLCGLGGIYQSDGGLVFTLISCSPSPFSATR
jgi:hypothetical protein